MEEEFVYTIENGTARIDRVRCPEATVVIPEAIDGCPVTELGAYVLADSPVEELYLPMGLRKIGAYGFYNCGQLRHIACGSRIRDLGAGVFAGTGGVEYLDITIFEGDTSGFKELLSELRQTLRVRIHPPESRTKDGQEGEKKGSTGEARLIFPEYYEESVENTPARILYIETHGCGHRYRYCFSGTQFQYSDYDELFPHVKVQEPEALAVELALGRLKYPQGLTEKYGRMYREYIKEHWHLAARLMMEVDGGKGKKGRKAKEGSNLDPGGIPWLVQEILECGQSRDRDTAKEQGNPVLLQEEAFSENTGQEDQLRELTRMAQQAGDMEAVAWLMNFQHQRSVPGKRRFEL